MAKEYLDKAGLTYFWGKIKTYVTNAVKVTGVKGNSESSYRTGNVNLTPANIGAVPTASIASGTISSTSVSANSYKDVTVSFGKTFSSAPHVVVGLNSTSTAGKIGLVSVAVYSVSTTQFVARFFNGDTTSRAPAAFWIAMGA